MFYLCNLGTARAALGALLLTFIAACSDAPSGPRQPVPGRPDEEATLRPPDDKAYPTHALLPTAGEKSVRRISRKIDGHLWEVDVVESSPVAPRVLLVSRDGQLIARMLNDWRHSNGGYRLERQRVLGVNDGPLATLADSRQRGGVASIIGAPIEVRQPVAGPPGPPGAPGAPGGDAVRSQATMRFLLAPMYEAFGPCDAYARVVEAALEDWLLSVGAMAGATASGNPLAAWTAFAYQLKKYRDVTRAEANLDNCVAGAGIRQAPLPT